MKWANDTHDITSPDSDTTFIQHEPCPSCGSKDNLARYSDGHGFCFGCRYHESGDGQVTQTVQKLNAELVSGEYTSLKMRKITEETCVKWGYQKGTFNGRPVQIAPYYKDGKIVAQKIRFPSKDFMFIGETRDVELFGQHLWRDSGKMLVVTEGEIDALSVSQAQGNKYPVVSVPNGAQGAKKAIQRNLEYVEKFDKVIFFFDMDDIGQAAAKECARLLTPGKACIANIQAKDANELLVSNRVNEIINAIWSAKVYRPDGIVNANELWDLVAANDDKASIDYPWKELNVKTKGLRKGELVTFAAGSGIGKSLACREIAFNLLEKGEKVGYVALEENLKRTVEGLMSIRVNQPLHLGRENVSDEDFKESFEYITKNNQLFLYDHFGSVDSDNLLARLRYLARGCGCDWLILDHISIMVSGLGDGDERRLIDNAMTMLRSLVEETGVGLILVSHLKRPEKKSHEEGGQTSLAQLRGSHAIAQLSDMVIGLERNQQSEDAANVTSVRVLKNRYTGETGVAAKLEYIKETGRLIEYTGLDTEEEFGDDY